MQPKPDYLNVPRRELDVEDYVDILRRHWMWIAGPTFLGLVVAVVVAFLWPDTYVSRAVMRITPPQVPQRVVPSNFSLELRERLLTMRQDVTSRGKLIDMVKKYNLYPKQQEKRPLEDIVEDMRRDIAIDPVDIGMARQPQGATAFRIEFSYSDRKAAQSVVNEIVGAFTSQNVVDRRQKSRITSEFLGEELRTAKLELDRIEGELTAFKMSNAGSMPEELQANLQVQRSYEMQLSSVQDALNRSQQDRMMLDTQLENLRSQLDSLVTTTEIREEYLESPRLAELTAEVRALEAKLVGLREQYRPEHPDIIAAAGRLETLRAERDAMMAAEDQARRSVGKRTIVNREAEQRRLEVTAQINSVQTRIQAIQVADDDRLKTQQQLNEAMRAVMARIQMSPMMQGEYAKLSRDYSQAKQHYDELNQKMSQAEVANRLEDRSAGENLEVLDTASLPTAPAKPNRWLIVGAGLAIGLAVGISLAGFREVKDTTMKGLKDVRAYTDLPVLSSVPLLENALLVRRKRRLTWLAWSSATILGVIAMSGSVYYYIWGR
ncbi:MAG: hypothetical protein IPM24_14775 [Bryobacterales bacterium]|nr:hypothetical protein [Bryobacterales bacterium]